MNKLLFLITLGIINIAFSQSHPEPVTLESGAKAIDFKLKGTDGKMYSLSSFKNAKLLVIIFSAPYCPTAQTYEERIIKIQSDCNKEGLKVVMINPNLPDAVCMEERGSTDLGDTFENADLRQRKRL